MRTLFLLVILVFFFLFCLGILNESIPADQEGLQEPQGGRNFPPGTDYGDPDRATLLARINSESMRTSGSPGGDIAYESGAWTYYAQRDMRTLMKRFVRGVGRFADGFQDARQKYRQIEQSEVQDIPPPRTVNQIAPNSRIEMFENEIESNEVESDVYYETRPQQRAPRSYVPE